MIKLQKKSTLSDWIKIICYVSLFASVTNVLPLSVSYVALVFIFPLSIIRKKITSKLQFIVFLMYIFFIISTFLYSPEALLSYSFYRRDGNYFITYIPLLLLPSCGVYFGIENNFKKFTIFTTVLNGICLFFFYCNINPFGLLPTETSIYHFGFYAHNAAGGYLGVISAIIMGYLLATETKKEKIIYSVCFLVNMLGLWETNSRGSILGIIGGMIFIYLGKVKIKIDEKKNGIDLTIFWLIFIIIFAIETYILLNSNGNWETSNFDKIPSQFQNSVWDVFSELVNRSWTVIQRVFYAWPQALYLFFKSPIIGCGFGSYNDMPYEIVEVIKGVLSWNMTDTYVYSDAHAHQSFFHILAETGIIGFGLCMFMLKLMRESILNLKNKKMSQGLYIALVVNVISSFTEHRLFTPSQMIPFILILAMSLSDQKCEQE